MAKSQNEINIAGRKGQDLTSTKNYRKIFVQNNSYKMLALILADRLKKILQEFIFMMINVDFYLKDNKNS